MPIKTQVRKLAEFHVVSFMGNEREEKTFFCLNCHLFMFSSLY